MEQPSARSSSCSTSATGAAGWSSRPSPASPTPPPRRCAASASCGWRRSTRASAARYFERTGRQAEIVEVKGSVELAPLTGLVEAIVDLTATGTTLRENGLVVREEIAASTARLIANPVAHKLKAAAIDEVVDAPARRGGAACRSSAALGGRRGGRRACAALAPGAGVGRRRGGRDRRRRARRAATRRCASTTSASTAPTGRCGSRPRSSRRALAALDPAVRAGWRSRSPTSARSPRAGRDDDREVALPAGPERAPARAAGAPRGGLRARRARAVPEHRRHGRRDRARRGRRRGRRVRARARTR